MAFIDTYSAGTVTLTNGSAVVTGNATNWISASMGNVSKGHLFCYGAFTSAIKSVDSATQITLYAPWTGSTVAGASYEVLRYSRVETPEVVGYLQRLLAKGESTNPFTRVDLDSGAVRASFRDDGSGNLGWYIGNTAVADGSQVKVATIGKAAGFVTLTSGLTVGAAFTAGANAALTHSFKQANDTQVSIYSDAAGEITLEALQASNNATKRNFNFNKYGGNSLFGGAITVAGTASFKNTTTFESSAFFGYLPAVSAGLWAPPVATYGKPALQAVTSAFAAEKLLLNPIGGNVAIGGNDALTSLHVHGSLTVSGDIVKQNDTGASAVYGGSAFDQGAGITLYGDSHATDPNKIVFTTGAYVPRMTLDAAGNFGIGTSAPAAKLHVAGSMVAAGQIAILNDSGATLNIGRFSSGYGGAAINAVNTAAPGTGDPTFLEVQVATVPVARFQSDGKVGIGATPADVLDVQKSQDAATRIRVVNANAGTSADARLIASNGATESGLIMRGTGHASAGHLVVFQGSTTAPTTFFTNGAERMRIDSDGKVGVGGTPVGKLDVFGTNGNLSFNSTGDQLSFSRNGFNYLTASGAAATLRIQATGASGVLDFATAGSVRMTMTAAGSVLAGSDNTQSLGGASNRWSVVYAGTGTINTSDAREKTKVRPLNAAELRAAQRLSLEIGVFQWLEAVKEKGEAARQHVGMTVQRAIEIMEDEGLDPWAYGFMCRDEITRRVKKTEKRMVQKIEEVEVSYTEIEVRDGVPVQVTKTRTEQRLATKTVAVVDEKGKPVTETKTETVERKVKRMEKRQKTEERVESFTEIEVIDGVPTQVTRKRTIAEPVFEDVPVLTKRGKPVTRVEEREIGVMLLTDPPQPKTVKVTVPVTHRMPVMVEEEVEVVEQETVEEQVPLMHAVPVMVEEEVEIEVDEPAGDRLGFRPGMLTDFMLRGMAENIAKLQG